MVWLMLTAGQWPYRRVEVICEQHHDASNNENKLLMGKDNCGRGGYAVEEVHALNLNSVRNYKNNYA
jgi:hypothetical protein